jgi:hypothetical protein
MVINLLVTGRRDWLCLAIAGFISCVIQLFVTPILLARCDHVRVYNTCMALWPYCFLALPLLNMVARSRPSDDGPSVREEALQLADVDRRVQAIVWCGIAALLALSRMGCLAFACVDAHFCMLIRLKCCNYRLSMILVKQNAPTPDSLGATNGLVQFAMCLTRSFCPAFARYEDKQGQWSYDVSISDPCILVARSLRRWPAARSSMAISGLSLWQ